ncbi:coagulation factor XIII A chain-like [Pseudoliparis swirei]|uniref:coagulation factor XIII A chain-like n=1 Tax=Pseudoliparis swirei TaxID=2059687 RepID=UPI0024BDEEF8|nr:coagulation factor XIII A chain-like [Pseudoliparis swirei]
MSDKPTQKNRGRYNNPVANQNFDDNVEDLPEYETFEDDFKPRGFGPADGSLTVHKVDMLQESNMPVHFTYAFDIGSLVVRRGQQFMMQVTFDREPAPSDDFQVEFLIGTDPSASKGSLMVVTFGQRKGGPWAGEVLERRGETLVLGVTPTANAIVGKFRTYVAVVVPHGIQRTKRNTKTDMYLLFNPWCQEDAVFLGNEAERHEYVLNDSGNIYQGSLDSVVNRDWMYGQFELGVLDACIHILDASRMPITDRGNVITVVRKGSAMINSQDDSGVLVGNWSDDYSLGQSPTSWTGSTKILLQYANTGVSVSFAQCWVFAGVFNTFLRALGIPSRVVTNFNSAHDNTGNLKTDLIFKEDGSPDIRNTRDSIWNYHCWNEIWCTRKDLPAGFGGWQVVDATPQETSDGHYRCGPASLKAIKEGVLCHPYDAGFVFAEVNSDVVFHKRDRYGTLTPYRVETALIGLAVYTKGLGGEHPVDVTFNYKYPEGSPQDEATMKQAEEYGCARDHSEIPDNPLTVSLHAERVLLGDDVSLQVSFTYSGPGEREVKVHLEGSVVFYTGVTASRFKNHQFTVTAPGGQTVTEVIRIPGQEYFPHLGSQVSLKFIVSGKSEDHTVTAIKVINLLTPRLTVQLSGRSRVRHMMYMTVSFTNPFNFSLGNVYMAMEGPGMMSYRMRYYSIIEPQGSISWTEAFRPRLMGNRTLVAVMDCNNLRQVMGVAHVSITA